VITDLKHESHEMAKKQRRSANQARQGGREFDVAARPRFEPKTSDLIARDGSIPGAASAKRVQRSLQPQGRRRGGSLSLGQNWLVYRVTEKTEPNPADFDKQKKQLTDEVLQIEAESCL